MKLLKKIFSNEAKFLVKLRLHKFRKQNFFDGIEIDPNRNQAYIFLAAEHANLGDLAITLAHSKFLEENTDYQVIKLSLDYFFDSFWFVKKQLKKNDLITILGGGNFGDLYEYEIYRQNIIRSFKNNKIVSFPQTFVFSDTKEGKRQLERAKKIYSAHKNLVLTARENLSLGLIKQNFPDNIVILTPDIVLYLDKTIPEFSRKGVVTCLRNDKEKFLSDKDNEFILSVLKTNFENVDIRDTHLGDIDYNPSLLYEKLEELLITFKSAELVVTDRLHGMIFCYITNTPCIVFQNNNHKISESYNWLMDADIHLFKKFCINEFNIALDDYKSFDKYKSLIKDFEPLIKEVNL